MGVDMESVRVKAAGSMDMVKGGGGSRLRRLARSLEDVSGAHMRGLTKRALENDGYMGSI